uniref:Dendritic cell-specific transmembrane protein-like domain-containing protein n=1 Tax=Wuchereria bancrofti TaxID=6293 RepID=A0AAF5Q0P0_WUCBA
MLINVLRKPKQRALKKLEELYFIAENCRRSVAGEESLVDKRKEFWMKCGVFFPPLYPSPKPAPRNAYERMFTHGTRENDLIRIVSSFLLCELVGLLFFVSIALKYSVFPSRLGVYVSIVVQLILSLMIPFPSIRAIILIAAVKLTTSRLRSIILMFIIVWAFQISATNTTRNLQMLAESAACVSDSAIQIGNKLVSEVNMQTNKLSLSRLKEQGRFFIKHLEIFRNTMRKLQNIVVKFGKQTKDYLVQLLTVKEYCQRFFIGPYYFCLRIFDESAQYCDRLTLYRRLPVCKFVKDMRMICDAARFGELVCDIPEKIKESLKSGFLTFTKDKMKAAMNSAVNDYNISFLAKEARAAKKSWDEFGISLNHTIEDNCTQTFQLEKMKEELEGVLNQFGVFVEILSTTISFIIPNLIIITFLMALVYVIKYKQKEKVDNVYITEEFRNVDMLREAQGQPSLLPLLPKERETAAGEGFLAKLLQRILHIFYPITGSQHSDNDWRQCFTEPNPPDFQLIRLMMLLYLIAFLLCILQVYVVRCRHLIAQYYWPERTKPRTLWLYNQVLEGRKNILTQLIKAAKEKELKEQLVEDEISGRGNLVNHGLTVLSADQYKCVRCFRSDLSIADARLVNSWRIKINNFYRG